MPINSWDIHHVPTVGLGTIEPTIQTGVGSALGVVNQGVELNPGSLQNAVVQMQLADAQMQMNQFFQSPTTAGTIFQSHVDDIWSTTPSPSQTLSDTDFNTHPTTANSSMNTKTKKEKPAAYKPVTLTLTGQLKPSTLTKVPRQKSSPSTKVPLGSILGGW